MNNIIWMYRAYRRWLTIQSVLVSPDNVTNNMLKKMNIIVMNNPKAVTTIEKIIFRLFLKGVVEKE